MSIKTLSYTSKELIRLLTKKDFVLDSVSGSHYIYMLPDGSRRAIISLHNKDLAKGLF